MSEYIKPGLKNVKCFGSSTAFANQMKNVKGVTGVTTFVKTNTVKILYSPDVTDTLTIQKAIFTPVKVMLRKPASNVESFIEYQILIDNFFDPLDEMYLEQLLLGNSDIYGMTAEFGCPVNVSIFTGSASTLDPKSLTELIETRTLSQPLTNGKSLVVKLKFKVKAIEKRDITISSEDLTQRLTVLK
jgi:copper chaperone CopZ